LDLLFEYLDLCLALRVECLDVDLGLKCLLTALYLISLNITVALQNCIDGRNIAVN